MEIKRQQQQRSNKLDDEELAKMVAKIEGQDDPLLGFCGLFYSDDEDEEKESVEVSAPAPSPPLIVQPVVHIQNADDSQEEISLQIRPDVMKQACDNDEVLFLQVLKFAENIKAHHFDSSRVKIEPMDEPMSMAPIEVEVSIPEKKLEEKKPKKKSMASMDPVPERRHHRERRHECECPCYRHHRRSRSRSRSRPRYTRRRDSDSPSRRREDRRAGSIERPRYTERRRSDRRGGERQRRDDWRDAKWEVASAGRGRKRPSRDDYRSDAKRRR